MRTDFGVPTPLQSVVNQVNAGETMKHPEDCEDCRKAAEAYEAATFAFFRLQSQFEIASFSGDSNALCTLAAEIDRIVARRLELKAAARDHLALARGQSAGR
jgi:hypothetical protein